MGSEMCIRDSSSVVNAIPGACSPSRSVVSRISIVWGELSLSWDKFPNKSIMGHGLP